MLIKFMKLMGLFYHYLEIKKISRITDKGKMWLFYYLIVDGKNISGWTRAYSWSDGAFAYTAPPIVAL